MSAATLSVVMPNFNHARYLARTIEEMLDQTRPPDEFLILDDASTDDSVQIIESYAQKHSCIRFVRNQQNMGVIRSNDRLFQMARSDYIYSAAADDSRPPRFFELAMQMAEQHPQAGVIFGKLAIVDEHDQPQDTIEVSRWKSPLYADPERFLREYLEVELPSHSACGATIYRRAALEEVGWHRAELASWADTFSVRAIGLKHGVCYVPKTFLIWRKLSGSFSGHVRADARSHLNLVARAAQLMRSGEFRDRFPERHVRRWQRRYVWTIINQYWRGESGMNRAGWRRLVDCLTRTPGAIGLLFYRGQTCHTGPGGEPS